jgi:hypothetical protein
MSPSWIRRCRFRPHLAALLAAAAVSHGCILAVPPEAYVGREKAEWLRGYGYASFGFAGHVSMFGDDMSGIEPSQGVSLNFPVAPGPVLVVGAAALIVVAAKEGDLNLDLSIDFWTSSPGSGSGKTKTGEKTKTKGKAAGDGSARRSADDTRRRRGDAERRPLPLAVPTPENALEGAPIDSSSWLWKSGMVDKRAAVFSDVAVDFTLSYSKHRDTKNGGMLKYTSGLVGVRLGGWRAYIPRWYLTGGVGIHDLRFENRPNANAAGPYFGAGLEFFLGNGNRALALDYKASFYLWNDSDDPVLNGGSQGFSVLLSLYW